MIIAIFVLMLDFEFVKRTLECCNSKTFQMYCLKQPSEDESEMISEIKN